VSNTDDLRVVPGGCDEIMTSLFESVRQGERRSVSRWYHDGMAMTLRTDAELDQALTELAEREHISKQEVVRRAVLTRRDATERRVRLDAIAADVMEEYAEALDRLGSV
jgi:predicted transcriptional regulator